jgi:Ca2+-binding RTX toxin-like protein
MGRRAALLLTVMVAAVALCAGAGAALAAEVSCSTENPTEEGGLTYYVCLGTPEEDTIYGTKENNFIYGLGGPDTIYGLDGHDEVYGEERRFLCGPLYCDPGVDTSHDTIYGQDGNDRMVGGWGTDMVYGGKGADWISLSGAASAPEVAEGGTGNDVIYANDDSDDLINCGKGKDTVYYDEGLDEIKDCEKENPPPSPEPTS